MNNNHMAHLSDASTTTVFPEVESNHMDHSAHVNMDHSGHADHGSMSHMMSMAVCLHSQTTYM